MILQPDISRGVDLSVATPSRERISAWAQDHNDPLADLAHVSWPMLADHLARGLRALISTGCRDTSKHNFHFELKGAPEDEATWRHPTTYLRFPYANRVREAR